MKRCMTRVMLVGLFAFVAAGSASAMPQGRDAGTAPGVAAPGGGNPWAAATVAAGADGRLLAHGYDHHRHDHDARHHDGHREHYRVAERYHDHGDARREEALRHHRAIERRRAAERHWAIEHHRDARFHHEEAHRHHDDHDHRR